MKSEDAKYFSARLLSALDDAGVRKSATVVANIFNQKYWGKSITSHTARSWMVGTSIPMQDKLVVLSDWLKVSPQELRFGLEKGESAEFRTNESNSEFGSLNLQDREMLRRYIPLSPANKNMVREMVVALSTVASLKKNNVEPPRDC
jgi:hypothetical protein